MADILNTTHRAIEQMRATLKRIVNEVPLENAAFSNVLRPLAQAENALKQETQLLVFYAFAAPDAKIREASTRARALLDDFIVEQAMCGPLFELVNAVAQREEPQNPEDAQYLAMKQRHHIQHGLELSDQPTRERLRELRSLISRDTSLFHANLANSDEGVWCSRETLVGVPESVLSTMESSSSEEPCQLKVLFSNHHIASVLRYAKDSETRRKVFIAYENQVPVNQELFRNVILLRDEVARLLGHSSYASLKLADRMAKTPQAVEAFHEDVRARLEKASVREVKELHRLKAQDLGVPDDNDDIGYYLWDQPYYNRVMLEQANQVDQQKVSEFFELHSVVNRMLGIFKEIFALDFAQTLVPAGCPDVWHQDVQVFTVCDTDDDGALLGWLYMDLYERTGKKSTACNFNLVPGFVRADGSRQCPSTALLCSFAKPSPTAPCLLRHDEIVTLFHELGHGIHDLVSKTMYACFHGTEVPVDFGEAPSQMLEYWCWTPAVLQTLSQHYSYSSPEYLDHWKGHASADTSRPEERLPNGVISSLIAAKNVNNAHFYLNQLRLSMFDLSIHSPSSNEALQALDVSALHNKIRSTIYPPRGPEAFGESFDWGHAQTFNRHAMQEDYSAGYYSYMFSKVFAADMFQSAFSADPLSPTQGRRYRYTILEKGGSRDAMEMLIEYLGRRPDSAAFNMSISGSA